VTIPPRAPHVIAAPPAVTTTAPAVPERVAASAEKSVLPMFCSSDDAAAGFVGTGFMVTSGVVTAAHVLAACQREATIWLAGGSGSVAMVDSRHDLALLTVNDARSWIPPLQLETAGPRVGEPLALIGIPAVSQFPLSGFQPNATIAPGIVLATHQAQQLTSAEGVPKTLTDAIRVTTSGTLSGESGGPAIDAAGKVVGVIEGGGFGVTTLTPVADLKPLH
jgi:S1-C subfamily serine protease